MNQEDKSSMQTLSIVVPVCNEEDSLQRAIPTLLGLQPELDGMNLEIVFVDDGSKDRSMAILLDSQCANPGKITIVQLTRNFGAVAAVEAGLARATGNCVAVIAADLQDPPELIPRMAFHWRSGIKAVFATRSDREEPAAQKAFSAAYYALFRRFAIRDYPPGGFDFMLLDRQVVDAINAVQEKNTNLMSLVFWLGYTHVLIPYVRRQRQMGRSKWTTVRKIKLFVDSFVAFSYAPIRFLSLLGMVFALGAFLYAGVVFAGWATQQTRVEGWTALMIFIAFTGGLQMTMLGVLGEYVWRTLDEVRRRPSHVVENVFPK